MAAETVGEAAVAALRRHRHARDAPAQQPELVVETVGNLVDLARQAVDLAGERIDLAGERVDLAGERVELVRERVEMLAEGARDAEPHHAVARRLDQATDRPDLAAEALGDVLARSFVPHCRLV
ncbi:MAG TPA: hypothetical protein PLJ34_02725 [Hyphomicrobiales bacterium]|nr:hypothetical protein [Hyphomicrobiales bacterium]